MALLGWGHAASAELSAVSVAAPIPVERSPAIASGKGESPAIASDGENALIVYTAGELESDIYLRLIGPDGVPKGGPIALGANLSLANPTPEVVFDGETYVVSWGEQTGEPRWLYRRVSTSGELLGEAKLVAEDPWPSFSWHIQHASAGEGRVLFARCRFGICYFRVLAGDVLSPVQEVSLPSSVHQLSAVYSDGVWAVAIGHRTVTLLQIGADGKLLNDTQVSTDPSVMTKVLLAAATDGFNVAWDTPEGWRIGGYDWAGQLTHDEGFGASSVHPLLLCRSGGELLLFASSPDSGRGCQDCERHYLQRLDAAFKPTGVAVDGTASACPVPAGERFLLLRNSYPTPGGMTLELGTTPKIGAVHPWVESRNEMLWPQGAAFGDGWAVAWNEKSELDDYRVRMTTLSSDGTPSTEPFEIATTAELSDLACQDAACLVVVKEVAPFWVNGKGYIVTRGAGSRAPAPAFWWSNDISVAASPMGFAVVKQSVATLGVMRLHPDGSLSTDDWLTNLAESASHAYGRVDIVFDGAEYVATWFDSGKIYSKRIPVEGPIGDDSPVALASSDSTVRELRAAYQGSDWWLSINPSSEALFGAGMVPETAPFQVLSAVGTRGGALLASTRQSSTELQFSLPMQQPSVLESFEGDFMPRLSDPSGDRVLLATAKSDSSWGLPKFRVQTRIVSLSDDTMAGGAGGNSTGGAAAAPSEGAVAGVLSSPLAGEASVGGNASSGSYPSGAGPIADTGAGVAGDWVPLGEGGAGSDDGLGGQASRSPATSKSCGCRAAGAGANEDCTTALLLVAFAAMWQRRAARR